MQADYAIIGGGIVGLSVAWGLLRRGRSVLVIDGEDDGFRASRGNFGLIWVQGKGLNESAYARWSQRSAAAWAGFAAELGEGAGVDLRLQQTGGYDFYLDEAELEARVKRYEALRETLGGDYPFEVLGANALRREEPETGPRVAGALLHHQDGHVNPLRLLGALSGEVRRLGASVTNGEIIEGVEHNSGGFRLTSASGKVFEAGKVVLAAGLGSIALGPKFGFRAPMRPQRGQVLITEKLSPLLSRPSGTIRQVDEGGIQIGASNEEVGFDDSVTLPTACAIAAEAVAVLPRLERAQLVRSWGALRIMSPDGLPIYQKSPTMPGASLVTCHSGITLAAAHANFLPDWLGPMKARPIWRCSVNNALPFKPIPGASVDSRPVVRITLDGEPVEAFAGDNLAAVLLAAGHRRFRDTAVSGAPRGPFCMMGACYDCLVEIDGVSRQACMTEVSDGMVVRRHRGRTADA